MKSKRHFEVFTGYLGSKINKNKKTISWGSNFPENTRQQLACDAGFQPPRCLLPNIKVSDVKSFGDTFHSLFDEHVMDVIVNKTDTKTAKTLSRLSVKPSFAEFDKYAWVRESKHIEVNGLWTYLF